MFAQFKNKFVGFFAICVMTLASNVYAQPCPPCPLSFPDHPLVGWTSGSYNVTIDGCLVQVCYCTRKIPHPTLPNTWVRADYYITRVTPLGSCSNFDETFMKKAAARIVDDNPASHYVPPCDEGSAFLYRTGTSDCLKVEQVWVEGKGFTYALQFCYDGGWCMQGFLVCADPISGIKTIIAEGDVVFSPGDDCDTPPALLSNWQQGQCYDQDCDWE